MRVLCVTAHADDMEIGCAGTLLRLQDQGHEIISLITVAPSAEVRAGRDQQIVAQELCASYQVSKFKTVIFNTALHANGRPDLQYNNNTMTALSALIPNVDIAVIPSIEDFHQDHKNTHNLVFPILQKRAKKIWAMHSWPYCHRYQTSPIMTRDISAQWETKLEMLRCYKSYIDSTALDQIKITNQFWAQPSGVDLAEAFTIIQDHD